MRRDRQAPAYGQRRAWTSVGWRTVAMMVIASTAVLAYAWPAAASTSATSAQCGDVLIPAAGWLAGRGVDVHSNARADGSTASCAGTSVANPAVQYGGGWQCVELAARLYYVRGWGTVFAGRDGGAQWIPEGSPGLQFYPNGSGYRPVPGDLIVEWGPTWGHVSVVNAITGLTIDAVEQNASPTAHHAYTWVGVSATGAYSPTGVRGFMHSPANGGASPIPSVPAALPPAPRSSATALRGHKARITWTPAASGAAPTGYQIWVRRYRAKTRTYSAGTVLTEPVSKNQAKIKRLKFGTTYRFNVRVGSAAGFGNWSVGHNLTITR